MTPDPCPPAQAIRTVDLSFRRIDATDLPGYAGLLRDAFGTSRAAGLVRLA